MSVSIRSGITDGAIQVNGIDAVTFNGSGLTGGVGTNSMYAAAVAAYMQPINNTGAASDLVLGVNQTAFITATGQTSIPLHIACGDGQIYDIYTAGTYSYSVGGNFILQPNNVAPATNAFYLMQLYSANATSGASVGSAADGGFRLEVGGGGIYQSTTTVFTSTLNKKIISQAASASTSTNYLSNITSSWSDTTTIMSSLGTIKSPNAWTGTITIYRRA